MFHHSFVGNLNGTMFKHYFQFSLSSKPIRRHCTIVQYSKAHACGNEYSSYFRLWSDPLSKQQNYHDFNAEYSIPTQHLLHFLKEINSRFTATVHVIQNNEKFLISRRSSMSLNTLNSSECQVCGPAKSLPCETVYDYGGC